MSLRRSIIGPEASVDVLHVGKVDLHVIKMTCIMPVEKFHLHVEKLVCRYVEKVDLHNI